MRFWLDVLLALIVSGVGVVAALLGEVDDAPGLVGIGCVLVAAAVGLGVRAGRRSAGGAHQEHPGSAAPRFGGE